MKKPGPLFRIAGQMSGIIGASRRSCRKGAQENRLVDVRQALEVGDRDAFVGLVHSAPDQPQLGHRAVVLHEARVRGAAGGAELGAPPGDLGGGVGEHVAERARRGQESLAGEPRLEAVAKALAARRFQGGAQPGPRR